MKRAALGSAAIAAALLACASARIEGGELVAPDAAPTGLVVGRWTIDDCHDANHAPAPRLDGTVSLVQMPDGKSLLVESRADSDTLVVQNRSVNEGELVFQVALEAAHQLVLREYRVSPAGGGVGRLSLISRVSGWVRPAPGAFTASYTTPALVCGLFPRE